MLKQTALHPMHLQEHAKMVDFAGWDMPLHYGSQLEEHRAVRNDAGMFDVSHMGIIDVNGEEGFSFLSHLLANNVAKLNSSCSALYTCMLNPQGGILDDLIVYAINPNLYRLVVNASTVEKDLHWIQQQAKGYKVQVSLQPGLSILAVQGPQAISKIISAFPQFKSILSSLKHFQCAFANVNKNVNEHDSIFIARTGYTGEDGVEMIIPKEQVTQLWQTLSQAGIKPVGLGARDTLRLEAGLNLYGQDMDESLTPLESNLAWTVALEPKDRDFIGRSALLSQLEEGVKQSLVGIVLLGKGVLRHDQRIFAGDKFLGKITSGSFAPTLNQSIALARLQAHSTDMAEVEIRGQRLPVKIVKPPFVRRKKS